MLKKIAVFCLIASVEFCMAAIIHVPAQQPTIQAAIDAAAAGDSIIIAPGRYKEVLRIQNKILSLSGAGADQCILHREVADTPHVFIDHSYVHISGMEFNGGAYDSTWDYYAGNTRYGIVAHHSQLFLTSMYLNQYINYMVTIYGGYLAVDEVTLYSRPYGLQCDIGFELRGCAADIYRLQQIQGTVDHTINIWGNVDGYGTAIVKVEEALIRGSVLSWGDCIRVYQYANLSVHNCHLYRSSDGQPPNQNHTGVSVNGYYIQAWIQNNTFDGLPWGISYYGSMMNSNQVVVENNEIKNSLLGGILVQGSHYEGLDLGGGTLGSQGYNTFNNPLSVDVKLDNSSANVYAYANWWSSLDPDASIWDNADDATLGKVLHAFKPLPPPLLYPIDQYTNQPVLSKLIWRRSGGAAIYHVQVSLSREFRTREFEKNDIADTTADIGPLPAQVMHYWRVRAMNRIGWGDWSSIYCFMASENGTGIAQLEKEVSQDIFYGSHPNPVNSRAIFNFYLVKPQRVRLCLYDLLGREVAFITDRMYPAGNQSLGWSVADLTTGVYFARMQREGAVEMCRVMVIR